MYMKKKRDCRDTQTSCKLPNPGTSGSLVRRHDLIYAIKHKVNMVHHMYCNSQDHNCLPFPASLDTIPKSTAYQ